MANTEQLNILRQGIEAWNEWREQHPDEKIDLRRANLQKAHLIEANLRGANLRGGDLSQTNLCSADLSEADLSGGDLHESNLEGAILYGVRLNNANLSKAILREAYLIGAYLTDAHLSHADLSGADLSQTDLNRANLHEANLSGVNLRFAQLSRATLTNAILTGVHLYATARDDWKIDDILCDYVFWENKPYFRSDQKDEEQQWEIEHRTPKDRDFRPGEFEELYKQLPTFEYVFEHGFTPIETVVMGHVVETINEQHPEFKLDLVNFDKRGEPHATFTVQRQKDVETAKAQVAAVYERRILALEAQKDQLMDVIKMLGSGGITIQTVGRDVTIKQAGGDIIGSDKDQRAITAGRNYFEQIQDQAQVTTGKSDPSATGKAEE